MACAEWPDASRSMIVVLVVAGIVPPRRDKLACQAQSLVRMIWTDRLGCRSYS